MDKIKNYKLIDGSFEVDEAKEVLLGLLDYKIQFHANKVFSTDIRFGEHDEMSSKRAVELKATRIEVEELIQKLNFSFKKLRITSTIVVEEIE
jgi:hypothetical protein